MAKTFLNLPHGLEVLIIKASVDPAFKVLLLAQRAGAADSIGLVLTPVESAMLAAIPPAALEATIAQTEVLPETRRVFLGKVAAAMLAALGVTGGSEYMAWGMKPLGCTSDIPSPIVGKDDYLTTCAPLTSIDERDLEAILAEIDQTTHTANVATSQTLPHSPPASPLPPWVRLASIFFDRGQAALRADQRSPMKHNLEIMKKTLEEGQLVLVISHSDGSGSPEDNLELCTRRAATVLDALLKGGIPNVRIKVKMKPGRATDRKRPADPKQIEAEAARERRVDFLILGGGKNEQSAKAGNADSTESEMIDLHELVKFPRPLFPAGHSVRNPPDALCDGWDVSPNSKRKD